MPTRPSRTKPRQAGSKSSLDKWERELTKQLGATWALYLALCRVRDSVRKAERR